jgi:prepilin-type N-terminal cleavage/methylation domain-containing protein
MKNRRIIDERGVSLVELTIVLALMGIILAVGYMFYDFGLRTFNVGEAKSNVQQNVRVASDYIARELRYAFEVQLLDNTFTIPESVTDDFNYIFINGDGAVEHRTIDGSTVLFGGSISGVVTDLLEFGINTDNDSILNYSIGAETTGATLQEYGLNSEIYIENLNLSSNLIKNITGDTGTAIRYIKDPLAPPSMLALPTVIPAETVLPSGFYFNMVPTFAEFNGTIETWHFSLGEKFDSLSIVSVTRVNASMAYLYVSGTLGSEDGIGTITVTADALTLNDTLTATVIVTPPVPVPVP